MATKLQQEGVLAKLASFKGLIQRFTFLSLIIAAFGLMMLGKADTILIERTRTAIADVAAPILDALSRPAATVEDFIAQIQELTQLREENARLREEVSRLRSWHSVATHLAVENQSLREMLNFVPPPRATFVSARVIADGSGPFSRSALLNVGSRNGITKGQAVVNDFGMIGRVIEVGQRSARVLLLTDFNSRVPVVFEASRERAILAGDNTATMRLDFVSPTAKITTGDRIVTSGHGGQLPAGLPVGSINAVKDGVPRVQPFVDWSRLEYVRVVDYPAPTTPESDGAEDEAAPAAPAAATAAPAAPVAAAARPRAQERPQ